MHYSRIMPPTSDHRYFTSTAVLLNEVLKLALSTTFAIYEASRNLAPQTPVTVLFEQIYRSVFSDDGWKLAIPATLYTLENTLQYVALGNLDPVHFQILYQLKVCRSIHSQHFTESQCHGNDATWIHRRGGHFLLGLGRGSGAAKSCQALSVLSQKWASPALLKGNIWTIGKASVA